MVDPSYYGIGAALLKSHRGTKKVKLTSVFSRQFTEADLRISTLLRECTAVIYTLTD